MTSILLRHLLLRHLLLRLLLSVCVVNRDGQGMRTESTM